jgi:hypothetical protein
LKEPASLSSIEEVLVHEFPCRLSSQVVGFAGVLGGSHYHDLIYLMSLRRVVLGFELVFKALILLLRGEVVARGILSNSFAANLLRLNCIREVSWFCKDPQIFSFN